LEQCTENAMTKYKTMAREEQKAAKRRSRKESLSLSQSLMIESRCNQLISNAHFLQCVEDEKSMSLPARTVFPDTVNEESQSEEMEKDIEEQTTNRRLADPYDEEWNGLEPENYAWDDDLEEGACLDDREMSVRDRRIQYLVVMAIDNEFCTISDLTYEQNELLLLYQDSMLL